MFQLGMLGNMVHALVLSLLLTCKCKVFPSVSVGCWTVDLKAEFKIEFFIDKCIYFPEEFSAEIK